jgi:N-formylglutamate amidohydrolase
MKTRSVVASWIIAALVVLWMATGIRAEQVQEKLQRTDAAAVERYVDVQKGELPIVISAPHGGRMKLPGVDPRTGENLPDNASKFVVLQDYGTEELARAVAAAVERRFGKQPYLVVARAHRRYLDPNRAAREAYEHELAGRIYRRYHEHLDKYCREVSNRFHGGILIDLHGQGLASDTVFRGTQNGRTVRLLRQRFGEPAHDGKDSLFGLLGQQGWKVHPNPLDGREQPGYTGGYIVRTYGSSQSYATDAIQLEFGRSYREATARKKTADQLALALYDYAEKYLRITVP